MTNKVKPFFIRITDDMTPQMVQDAFDKCVDAGASPDECVAGTNKKHKYQDSYGAGFNYLGTSIFCGTYLANNFRSYGDGAQEITLNQLDEWLGLEVKEEWVNGDECIKDGAKYIYVSKHPLRDSYSICVHLENGLTYSLFTDELSKPETPEQKADRERLEAIKEMAQTPSPCDFAIYDICEQLYDAGYRKQQ